MYDLSTVLETEAVSEVRPGTSVLIAGPAMTGKEALAMEILADGSRQGQGALIVSTSDSAQNVVEDYRTRVEGVSNLQLGVVDCRADGSNGRGGDASTPPGLYVHHVSSPGDLTGIGIGITKCLESLHANGAETGRVALVSLSTMLTYTDRETVFKFCHVLSSRLDAAGYIGVFTIDTGAHDEQTLQVIKQAFDGLVEIREADGAREARVLGLTDAPTAWAAL
ncbi:MAG: RAD55 family ATPase [Haloarculaceae archaeon]